LRPRPVDGGDRVSHVAGELALARQDECGHVSIGDGVRQFQRAVCPVLGGVEVARVVVEPSAELAVFGLQSEQLVPVGASCGLAELMYGGDLLLDGGDRVQGAEQIVIVDQDFAYLLQVLDGAEITRGRGESSRW
jgi:hypothetical protein